MSEGIKEKEQEKISKDAFFQSLNGGTLGSTLGLGKDRSKPLGKESTNDDDVATVTPPVAL